MPPPRAYGQNLTSASRATFRAHRTPTYSKSCLRAQAAKNPVSTTSDTFRSKRATPLAYGTALSVMALKPCPGVLRQVQLPLVLAKISATHLPIARCPKALGWTDSWASP